MKKAEFCNKCGKILRIENEPHNKKMGECTCGFEKEVHHNLTISEKIPKKEKIGRGIIKQDKSEGFPHVCKKCGYNQCEIEDLGAQYSDESNVYLYKCKKCGFTERQADGTGNN